VSDFCGCQYALIPVQQHETPAGERRAINVGRTNEDGTPVKKEIQAKADLESAGGIPTEFVPYDR
jgi:hypothetical protein